MWEHLFGRLLVGDKAVARSLLFFLLVSHIRTRRFGLSLGAVPDRPTSFAFFGAALPPQIAVLLISNLQEKTASD